MPHYSSLRELYRARLREFYRQPARIFWVYGFPLIMAVGLGLAFRNRPPEGVRVDLVDGPAAAPIVSALRDYQAQDPATPRVEVVENGKEPEEKAPLIVRLRESADALHRLNTGKSVLVVLPGAATSESGRPALVYKYDETRPEARMARATFDDVVQRAFGRPDPVETGVDTRVEFGSRYIDFLIPGLIALNTMGGGLWGVGFLLVNFRIAKLLKRFMATPMPRRNFLFAVLGARLTFLIPDVGVLLLLGVLAYRMPIRGSLAVLALVEFVGALAFAGIGLLVASRAKTTETVSGLMNLVMLPMWLLSGVFFSSANFPAAMQWFIQALPLTQLCDALRLVILEGAGLGNLAVVRAVAILGAWAVGTFVVALRIFRWT